MTSKHWKLVTIFFLLVAIGAVGHVGWEQRQSLLEKIANSGKKINLDPVGIIVPSQATQTQLKQFVDSNDNIVGITLVKVDFQANTRESTFRYFAEPKIEEAWAEFTAKGVKVPLFGYSESLNQRIVNLINGQFQCLRTLDTASNKLIPIISQYSLATCLVPIPPGYGDFTGFFNVYLRRQPTGAEVLELEKKTSSISLDIYQRDIVKSTRSFGDTLR